jgi:hypothetical protein
MGWNFHRIWGTDWYRTQKRQIGILKKAIETAVETSRNSQEMQPQPLKDKKEKERDLIERLEKEEEVPEPRPYILTNGQLKIYNRELLELPYPIIADVIAQILKIEGPLHLNDAARRITDSMGIGRIGNRISAHIFLSANFGHQKKMFHMESEFLYENEDKKVEIRDRSNLPNTHKKIQNVPPEEIQQALLETIRNAFSIPTEEAISEALSKLGFGRATQKAREVIGKEIIKLKADGKIKKEQDRLVLADTLYNIG